MKIATTRQPVRFTPVDLTLRFESQTELDAFTAVMARSKKIPDAMFHEDRYSPAVSKLLARGIDPDVIERLLKSVFAECLTVGGKP